MESEKMKCPECQKEFSRSRAVRLEARYGEQKILTQIICMGCAVKINQENNQKAYIVKVDTTHIQGTELSTA